MAIVLESLKDRDYSKIAQSVHDFTHVHLRDQAILARIVERIDRPGVANSIIASVLEIAHEYNRETQRPEIILNSDEERMKNILVRL